MKAFFKAERIWILTPKPGRLFGVFVKICSPSSVRGVLEKQMQKNSNRGRGASSKSFLQPASMIIATML